jgi:hypothetical protein
MRHYLLARARAACSQCQGAQESADARIFKQSSETR